MVFLSGTFQENKEKFSSKLNEESSTLEIGKEFISLASNNQIAEYKGRMLGNVIDIDEVKVLNDARSFANNEEILERGVRLTDAYNRIVYEFSAERISYKDYIIKVYEYRIKYEKFMTAINSYIGKEDILVLKNSMLKELNDMKFQIREFENSRAPENDWELISEYDKYRKFLPSMFNDEG